MVKVKEADLVWSQICSSLLHSLIQEAFVASVLCWYCTRFWRWRAAAAAKLLQSCPTLCDPIDGSPPGSPIPGILQARTLEWVDISFNALSEKWKWSCSVISDSSRPHGLQPTRLLHPWVFPGKSTGEGCHFLIQRMEGLASKSS